MKSSAPRRSQQLARRPASAGQITTALLNVGYKGLPPDWTTSARFGYVRTALHRHPQKSTMDGWWVRLFTYEFWRNLGITLDYQFKSVNSNVCFAKLQPANGQPWPFIQILIGIPLDPAMTEGASKIAIGSRLGSDLTVLGIVDDRGTEPVYLVWHHKSWCPMLCKALQSNKQAQREADILLRLAHPNIVRCFGVSGTTWLLMEYLEGPSLHHVAKSRPKRQLGISDAMRISIYVGAALSHVHERGLLHLDVKPSNVVIVRARPILCDFGIARWQSAPRPSAVRGTEGYMAPEVCLQQEITPAADVFGLGVTIYELLTGKMPFPEKVDGKPYPQISRRPASIRRHRPAVPAGLEKLVLSCLARDPKKRPDLAELLPSLHRYIGNGPRMWPRGFHPEIRLNTESRRPKGSGKR